MKKRLGLRALALTLVMTLLLSINVWAVDETNADRLHDLGLFRGTGSGYALENTASRLQGLIMLTRLLGEEDAALRSTADHPFTDVAAGEPGRYVAYGYEKGYTAGQTIDRFNPGARIEFRHYVTFLLRALGYNDKAGDFTFATSLDKAVEIGMMDRASADLILREGLTFYRSDLVDLSLSALTMNLKNSSSTLAETLVKRGVFTQAQGQAQKVLGAGKETYVHPRLRNTAPAQPAASSAITKVSKTYTVASGSVSADVITVDVSDPSVTVKAAMVNNRLGATANFSDIVSSSGAAVVVNGNFFQAYNDSKFPIGHVMVNGEFLYGNTGLSSLGITKDGEAKIGRALLFTRIKETNGKNHWSAYEVNTASQGRDLSVMYTPAFGDMAYIKTSGYVMTVTAGYITDYRYVEVGPTATIHGTVNAVSAVDIPADGYVVYMGEGFASTSYFRTPVVGKAVEVEYYLQNRSYLADGTDDSLEVTDLVSVLSGAPRLVEKGAICTTLEAGFQEARFTTAVTPRTAVGTLADGKLVIVSTSAASIQQMRELMLQLGCTDAINLDGGASTALAYNGQIVRNAGRPLTTTLQVFLK